MIPHVGPVHAGLLALVLPALLKGRGRPPALLRVPCAALVLGRLGHAWGVSQAGGDFRFRVRGVAATFGVLDVTSVLLLAA